MCWPTGLVQSINLLSQSLLFAAWPTTCVILNIYSFSLQHCKKWRDYWFFVHRCARALPILGIETFLTTNIIRITMAQQTSSKTSLRALNLYFSMLTLLISAIVDADPVALMRGMLLSFFINYNISSNTRVSSLLDFHMHIRLVASLNYLPSIVLWGFPTPPGVDAIIRILLPSKTAQIGVLFHRNYL